jgi:hypothetical protein
VGYVQRNGYFEAIRTSQQSNDSSRKSDSGTTETASQTLLRSKREIAGSRAVRIQEGSCGKQSSPNPRGKLREAEQSKSKKEEATSRASCGGRSEVESRQPSRNRRSQQTSTPASPQRVVYPNIAPRQVSSCSIHA